MKPPAKFQCGSCGRIRKKTHWVGTQKFYCQLILACFFFECLTFEFFLEGPLGPTKRLFFPPSNLSRDLVVFARHRVVVLFFVYRWLLRGQGKWSLPSPNRLHPVHPVLQRNRHNAAVPRLPRVRECKSGEWNVGKVRTDFKRFVFVRKF